MYDDVINHQGSRKDLWILWFVLMFNIIALIVPDDSFSFAESPLHTAHSFLFRIDNYVLERTLFCWWVFVTPQCQIRVPLATTNYCKYCFMLSLIIYTCWFYGI